jgi:serine phosphatase RsbU (regulator of sigma subunit)
LDDRIYKNSFIFKRITSLSLMKTILSFSFFLIVLARTAYSQEGSPLLTHFREDREIENQNWSICQDRYNVMLFANRKGILSFDGEEWTGIKIPVTPFTLKPSPKDEKIYVGGENSYGFIERDSKGIYNYVSLSEDSAAIGLITRIVFSDSLVIFYGENSVSFYDAKDKSLSGRIASDVKGPFSGIFVEGKNIFINLSGKGLFRVEADTLLPFVNGSFTSEIEILFSLPYDNKRVLLGFSDGRLMLFDGTSFRNYYVDDDGYIRDNILSEGIAAADSLYAFSTLGGGAVVVEKTSGKLRLIINSQKGLPDDEILASGHDESGGLWLSHPLGLTRVDLRLPVGNYGIYPGLTGNLSSAILYNNELYVATSEGVFYLAKERRYVDVEVTHESQVAEPGKNQNEAGSQGNSRKGIFSRIFGRRNNPPNNQSPVNTTTPVQTEKIKKLKSIDYVYRKIPGLNDKCRQLVATGNGILAATNRGLCVISNHTASMITGNRYINYIAWGTDDDGYAVAANDGYFIASCKYGKWRIQVPDNAFSSPVYSVFRTGRDTLWLGGDNIIYKAELGRNADKVSYRSFRVNAAFSQRCMLHLVNDTIFMFTETGISFLNRNNGELSEYRNCVFKESTGESMRFPLSNLPFIITGGEPVCIKYPEEISSGDLCMLKLFDEALWIYCQKDKIWVIDGNNSLYGIRCGKNPENTGETNLFIKNIRNEKGVSFGLSDVEFERGNSVINFDIIVPGYLKKNLTQYQYYIKGVMDDWSPWSDRTSYSRGVPKAGEYTLLVRSKDLWGRVGEPVSLDFRIKAPFTRTTLFYSGIIVLVFFILVEIIKIREKQLQEKNRVLEEKVRERTARIEAQKEEITSSIAYASRIQMAMLPVNNIFSDCFSDSFILFRPRDLVSGDFYWIGEDERNIFFTVADCTGHGVPGAFMSALGISILNEIIKHNSGLKANLVLNLLRDKIKTSLHQTGKPGEAADGMDISLCVMRKTGTNLQFSGAFNPLFVCTDGELREIKADRMPIGIHYGDEPSFTNHDIKIRKGDSIYLLSDGLTDQFGGPEGSKFKKAQFRKLLSEIHHLPMKEQKQHIEKEFLKWKGKNDQVDDVTVLGVRV